MCVCVYVHVPARLCFLYYKDTKFSPSTNTVNLFIYTWLMINDSLITDKISQKSTVYIMQ